MKAITLHDIDPVMEKLIVRKSLDQGLSLNKTIKRLLEQALGIKPVERGLHRQDFAEFNGVWSKKEFDQFTESTQSCRTVDKADWQ
jgi:hypothetical protein